MLFKNIKKSIADHDKCYIFENIKLDVNNITFVATLSIGNIYAAKFLYIDNRWVDEIHFFNSEIMKDIFTFVLEKTETNFATVSDAYLTKKTIKIGNDTYLLEFDSISNILTCGKNGILFFREKIRNAEIEYISNNNQIHILEFILSLLKTLGFEEEVVTQNSPYEYNPVAYKPFNDFKQYTIEPEGRDVYRTRPHGP